MTPDEFIALFKSMRDSSIPAYETYAYCEKIHISKFGYRKYRNYDTFKSVKSKRLKNKLREM